MLVTSQLPIETTNIFYSFSTCTCAPHFEIGSATHALYNTFDKCFYICDVAGVKSLYITFLIHKEQFALVPKSMH